MPLDATCQQQNRSRGKPGNTGGSNKVNSDFLVAVGSSRAGGGLCPGVTAPGIAAGCILVFIPSLGAFITPELLGGGKSLMIGNLINIQFGSSRNWPFGSAIALLLMALVLISLLIYVKRSGQKGASAHG